MRIEQIIRRRLTNQGLAGSGWNSVDEVVGALGAMQAQEFAVARWSIAQRARGVTAAAVDRAFATGALLRTHVLRPTWHFVRPADIRWMLQLTAPRVHAVSAYYFRQQGVTDQVFANSRKLLERALAGRQLTRKAIAAALAGAGIVADNLRFGLILMRAELDQVICSGALQGKQQTYALLDERAGKQPAWSRDEALAELARRYFTTRGPATVKDFSWWSGLTMADGRRGLDMLGTELDSFEIDGRRYWFADRPPARKDRTPRAHLLQAYDEYTIAYSESRPLAYAPGLSWAGNVGGLAFFHAVAIDGLVTGQWRRAGDSIATHFRRPLPAAHKKALTAELARYRRFVGG